MNSVPNRSSGTCHGPELPTDGYNLTRPPFLSLHETGYSEVDVESALQGDFWIRGGPVVLRPPIDWSQNPFGDRSWCFWLQSLIALDLLLQAYHRNNRVEALYVAADIALDWIKYHSCNNRKAKSSNKFAWYDMAVATRGCYLAYIWRAGAQIEILSTSNSELLRQSCELHATWLADNANYAYANNHGLYQDAGLFVIAHHFGDHPESEVWRQRARDRYRQNLASTIAEIDAVHLEHSPGYHRLIFNLMDRFHGIGLRGEDIDGLVDRMKDSVRWFTTPAKHLAQLGDTDLKLGPKWARKHPPYGLRLFNQAGYAVVRENESYLAMTAGYHSRFHKHNDELSFVLYEGGGPLVVDAGRYGYYYKEPGRLYAVSQRAHNGVVFNQNELDCRDITPYGSGVVGGARANGWNVIEGINPIAQKIQKITHRRLFLYQPGRRLLIVDSFLKATGPAPSATQYFHLAPGARVFAMEEGSLYVETEHVHARVRCLGCSSACTTQVIEGQIEPEVQGWTFPRNREWVRSPTIEFYHEGPKNIAVTSMEFNSELKSEARYVRILYDGEVLFEEAGPVSESDAPCETFSITHDVRGTWLRVD